MRALSGIPSFFFIDLASKSLELNKLSLRGAPVTTILLEAMILNKPTITSLVYSDWFEDDEMIRRGATLTVRTKEDFELALKKILNNTEFRNNLIKKGNEFVNDFLENQGQSVKSIKKLLENSKLE